jgi:thioredoxin-related protein
MYLLIILIIISIYYLNINSDKEGFVNLDNITKYVKKKTKDLKYNFNQNKRVIRNKLKEKTNN